MNFEGFTVGHGYHSHLTGNFYVFLGKDPDGDFVFVSTFHNDIKDLCVAKAHRLFDYRDAEYDPKAYSEALVYHHGFHPKRKSKA